MTSRWVPWLATALVWLVAAAGAAAWALPLLARPIPLPAQAAVVGAGVPLAGPAGLERLLGQPIAPPALEQAPAQSRFKLLGVVAPRTLAGALAAAGSGLALLSIDGKLPRAFVLGAEVESGLRVLKVGLRRVELGAAGSATPTMVLELPPLTAAAGGPGADLVVLGAAPTLPFRPGANPTANTVRPVPMFGVGIPGAGFGPSAPIPTDGVNNNPNQPATDQNGDLRR